MLSFLVLLSCHSSSPPIPAETETPVKVPRQLVFEREVSGRVMAYDLKRPSGLALSVTGDLYISDTGNHRLIKLDRRLNPVRDYGGYGSGIGKFQNPEDIVIDRGLNLYVLDTGNRRVVQLDANLNYVDDFKAEDDPEEIISTLGKLSGVQVSSLGEITVADYDNSRLIRMDNFKRFSRYIGDFGYGEGSLLNPLGLAADKKGRIYVADAGNGRIAVYDDYGNYLFRFGRDKLGCPSAVAVSPTGIIWVSDMERQSLFAFGLDGRLLMQMGGGGAGAARDEYEFNNVEAIAVSPDGYLYVADSGNNRVLVYRIIYEENR